MRSLIYLGSAFLVSCAPTPSAESSSTPHKLQSVAADVKSWGVTLRSWSVDADGRVEFSSGGQPGKDPANTTIEFRRLTLTPAAREELAAAVVRIREVLAQPEHCDLRRTDGPYGTFRWNDGSGEQSLPFDGNCEKGRDAELGAAVFAADRIVEDAAKAVAPVETRPATQER
ncbi:hypothetical protein GCM10023264_27540 [Sphingomonas daechungensis]|uniref:hypothetical protein n=1 Tax=Sphingomonas daechungensis TaxID=1176646 RepID=UPI0031EB913A